MLLKLLAFKRICIVVFLRRLIKYVSNVKINKFKLYT